MTEIFYTTRPVQSRAFLLRVLGMCGVRDTTIVYGAHGKPALQSGACHFNLSHSGSVTAVAVSDGDVGLDLQLRDKKLRPALLSRCTPAEREEDFFRMWTAKEADGKYCGGALAAYLPRLEFAGGVLYEDKKPIPAHLSWTELAGCVLCVCTRQTQEPHVTEL